MGLFLKVRFEYLKEKYWIYWTVFKKYFIPGPYLMDPISRELFSNVLFKYLEENIGPIGSCLTWLYIRI